MIRRLSLLLKRWNDPYAAHSSTVTATAMVICIGRSIPKRLLAMQKEDWVMKAKLYKELNHAIKHARYKRELRQAQGDRESFNYWIGEYSALVWFKKVLRRAFREEKKKEGL